MTAADFEVWTIDEHSPDHPGKVVARSTRYARDETEVPEIGIVLLGNTLNGLRAVLRGMKCQPEPDEPNQPERWRRIVQGPE